MDVSEKEILIRAIYYLLSNNAAETRKIFPEIFNVEELNYIDNVLKSSNYFDDFFIGNLVNGYTLKPICKIVLSNKDDVFIENAVQSYLDERLDLSEFVPKNHPKPAAKNHTNMKRIISIIDIIIKHPLWSAIIAGLILLLITYLIFGKP